MEVPVVFRENYACLAAILPRHVMDIPLPGDLHRFLRVLQGSFIDHKKLDLTNTGQRQLRDDRSSNLVYQCLKLAYVGRGEFAAARSLSATANKPMVRNLNSAPTFTRDLTSVSLESRLVQGSMTRSSCAQSRLFQFMRN